MVRRFRHALFALTGALLLLWSASTATAAGTGPSTPPDSNAYFGVFLGNGDSPASYVQRSGLSPADYGQFVDLPLTSTSKSTLSTAVDAIQAQHGKLFLTVEPNQGLSSVTSAVAQDLASTLAGYNSRGVDVFLRFAHEMNGSWYAWGQQPSAYVNSFRQVADAVHASAPGTAMVWSPNYGGGYPFTGGTYSVRSGTADYKLLDTNGNGSLSMADDPYSPYYPGDGYVDWVGLTLYHFGNAWPYGENETPEAGKFAQQLQGTYNGNGQYEDQSAVPDYYQSYAVGRGKPLAISETGALFNESPPQPGNSEYEIKSAWIKQVYGPASRTQFPQLKLINWFEIRKFESEANGTVDWRATANSSVADVLRSQVTGGGYVFAGASSDPSPSAPAVTPPGAPTSLTGTGAQSSVTLSWKAPTSNGGAALTGYVACRNDTGFCQTLSASSLTASFSNLNRKTAYTFSVRATNSVGNGAATTITVRTK